LLTNLKGLSNLEIEATHAASIYSGFDLSYSALRSNPNHKNNFENVAKQRFQNYSWFGFKRRY